MNREKMMTTDTPRSEAVMITIVFQSVNKIMVLLEDNAVVVK